jgi:hypothetical protein
LDSLAIPAENNVWKAAWRFVTSPTLPIADGSGKAAAIGARDRNAELERDARNTEVTEGLVPI